jgi:uncharacterized membrane protein
MYSIIIMILICIREYFYMKSFYNVEWDTKMRKYTKSTGWILRATVVLSAYPNITLMLLLINIGWTVYDISCALGLGKDWYYLGTTSNIDRWGKRVNYGSKIVLFILLIILVLI